MIFSETELPGVVVITLERQRDERGTFARTFCGREFAAAGLPTRFVQQSASVNARTATLRGMHWQSAPYGEGKLIRCVRGAVHDVVADLRPDSPTRLGWQAFRFVADEDTILYIPAGLAHGFLTLADDTEVVYAMTEFYTPEAARGFRYDDPAFRIAWPAQPAVTSGRDLGWPPYAGDLG